VLTTFEVARRDIALLDDLAWSAVFIDEAHRVKNPKSKITVAFNQFTCLRRFGLTGKSSLLPQERLMRLGIYLGTTIQNSYMEAWTILDWTNPGRLGTSKQWKGYVVKPLTIGQSASATEEERTKALVSADSRSHS
jgi:SNF2 family DNA or RNA helicase